MKKLFSALIAILAFVCAFAFTACYGNGGGNNQIPEDGKADAEIFKLVGNDYEKVESAFFDEYRVATENTVVAVLQVRNTGSLFADYTLTASVNALPEGVTYSDLELYVAEFVTAPQLVSEAIKNGEFAPFGNFGTEATLVSTGSIKVGSAKYYALMVELPDSYEDELIASVAKAITVNVSAVKHVPVVIEE